MIPAYRARRLFCAWDWVTPDSCISRRKAYSRLDVYVIVMQDTRDARNGWRAIASSDPFRGAHSTTIWQSRLGIWGDGLAGVHLQGWIQNTGAGCSTSRIAVLVNKQLMRLAWLNSKSADCNCWTLITRLGFRTLAFNRGLVYCGTSIFEDSFKTCTCEINPI